MSLKGSNNAEKIWNFFKDRGFNDYGCAGLLGNINAESALNPLNLQNNGNKKLGMTDEEFKSRPFSWRGREVVRRNALHFCERRVKSEK